jgi:hypothetical protein
MSDGFHNIDELPLGKLVQIEYPKDISRKKKRTLAGRIKLKGPRKKDQKDASKEG